MTLVSAKKFQSYWLRNKKKEKRKRVLSNNSMSTHQIL